jgi:ribonucleoside-triphosphate reductase
MSTLPDIKPRSGDTTNIVVMDSKEGWAAAFQALLYALWRGDDVKWDTSAVRPRGARLLTMGGRASGPDPLEDLFRFCVRLFEEKRNKKQRRLLSIEALDIENKVAEIVVVGGVRRSSEICLSDLSDQSIAEGEDGRVLE